MFGKGIDLLLKLRKNAFIGFCAVFILIIQFFQCLILVIGSIIVILGKDSRNLCERCGYVCFFSCRCRLGRLFRQGGFVCAGAFHDIAVFRINELVGKIDTVAYYFIVIDFCIIALRVEALTAVSFKTVIGRIGHCRTCKRGDMHHVTGSVIFIGIVVIHREIFMCMSRKPYYIGIFLNHFFKLGICIIGCVEKSFIVRITHSVACTEFFDR